jgi:hypothetical protein
LAIQLLRSRYYARQDSGASFEIVVTQKEAQELARKSAKKYLNPDYALEKDEAKQLKNSCFGYLFSNA